MSIVIVGAGLAGGTAATELREQGHEGPVVLVGAEDHPPYERPPLSKGYLLGNDVSCRDLQARDKQWTRAKGLDAQFEVAHDVPRRLSGDEARLRDVLTNLCDNAVKFTSAGKVAVSVELAASPEQAERPELRFAVSDSGIGMDADTARQAFEPFFQADSKAARHFHGVGLGLTIAQHLVRLMGGAITVQSAPGRGATFSFSVALDVERDAVKEPMHA